MLVRVLGPLAGALVLILAAMSLQVSYSHDVYLRTIAAEPGSEAVQRIEDAERATVETMKTLADGIGAENAIAAAWKERDREKLLALLNPHFERMADQLSITHLNIHEIDGTNYLRVHAPERSGGQTEPWTIREATRTGQMVSGFEGGITGMFTLRAVVPWRSDGEIIGWIELGKEFDAFAAQLDDPIITAVPKQRIDRAKYEQMSAADGLAVCWDRFEDYVVSYSTSPLMIDLLSKESDVDGRLSATTIVENRGEPGCPTSVLLAEQGDQSYAISGALFSDAAGDTAGLIFVLREITQTADQVNSDKWVTIASFAGICVAVYIFGWVILTRINARLNEQTAGLIEARESARKALAFKTDFLANMSHEIRTPMTAILGWTDVLAEDDEIGSSPERRQELIQTIRRNGEHLLTILDDILDVSKLEAGQMTIELLETSPAQIAEEVGSLLRPKATRKGIQVSVIYDTPIPEQISTDPTRLRQILCNLVSNAIKFTEQGSVSIHVAHDSNAKTIEYRIVDTGIGMTPQQRDAITRFEAFTQADTSTTRKFGGTGLGLRISNTLAKKLGGSIEVESSIGEGSVFTVTISAGKPAKNALVHYKNAPRNVEHARAGSVNTSQTAPNSTEPRLRGVRVLLAEDGLDNQRLISFHLEKAGAAVTIFENGLVAAEAIERSDQSNLPQVVLMDMQMPELDGYDATKRLRRGGFRIPIIALTAHAMPGDRQKCIDAGCDDYLTKPVNKERLISICETFSQAEEHQSRAA